MTTREQVDEFEREMLGGHDGRGGCPYCESPKRKMIAALREAIAKLAALAREADEQATRFLDLAVKNEAERNAALAERDAAREEAAAERGNYDDARRQWATEVGALRDELRRTEASHCLCCQNNREELRVARDTVDAACPCRSWQAPCTACCACSPKRTAANILPCEWYGHAALPTPAEGRDDGD